MDTQRTPENRHDPWVIARDWILLVGGIGLFYVVLVKGWLRWAVIALVVLWSIWLLLIGPALLRSQLKQDGVRSQLLKTVAFVVIAIMFLAVWVKILGWIRHP